MSRTTKADLAAQGVSAFVRAVMSLGHHATGQPRQTGRDLTVTIDGIDVPVVVVAAAVVNPETVARMVGTYDGPTEKVARIAVGDLVTGSAEQALRAAGWGWLDRRGHLVLRTDGVHIDAAVPPDGRLTAGRPERPIVGVAAISWAAALLLSPDKPPAMREVARKVSISHSAIVTAAKKLRSASLILGDGRPLVPELFWSLTEAWGSGAVALAELPPQADRDSYGELALNRDEDGPGWSVAGTVGAVAWGAPIVIGKAYPPHFYLPSGAEVRQATLRLGEAARYEDRACTVAVAPTPLVCAPRYHRGAKDWAQWRFAHGLFCALDLAQDQGRGAEALADWQPEDFARVW